ARRGGCLLLRGPPARARRGCLRGSTPRGCRRTHEATRLGRASDHHSELLREADVALDHVAHVVHVIAELQGALDTHAEGEALVFLWVDAGRPQHISIDHAASAPLDPTGAALGVR